MGSRNVQAISTTSQTTKPLGTAGYCLRRLHCLPLACSGQEAMAVLPQPTGEADPTKVTLRAIRAAEELSQALHHLHLPTGSMGEQAHTLAVAMAETTGNTCSVTETTGNTCTCPVTTGESCPVTDTHVPQVARVWR